MSRLLLIINENASTLTMSSREIAELCEKEHRHVLRDIRAYVGAVLKMERGIDVKSLDWEEKEGVELFGHTPVGGVICRYETNPQNNQSYPVYYLDKAATLTVVSGYNILLRKRIIDRWLELENQQTPTAKIPQSFSEALLLAAELQAEKERNAPKVAFVDHYVEVGTSKSLRETAKILNMPEKAMINRLLEDKLLYRQSGNLLPYQSAHSKELFTVKTGTAEHGHNFTQTRVTSKGIEFIASRYASELMV
ncbi:phage antirepressor KilAC domain-containing protein [Rodentibacter genomosp. 2]|uniref:Antirepressor n=1 Tax=Rodentibacter genomosp. 2 TaxID=1908266 RepID=A0A1V3JB62_9PAST|nr:phage regulatory protein/antirepressor Ant [Rodentibacter genomosp. 2]OOF53854.1 antirepressor [Rodentibacter genomosp. 2]